MALEWVKTAGDTWTVSISAEDAATTDLGSATVTFGAASGSPVSEGTIGLLGDATGTIVSTPYEENTAAILSFTAVFGTVSQTIELNLGNYGQTGGVTQFAGSTYNLRGLTQNGVPPGSFSGVSMQQNGNVVVNYDNGQIRKIAQVPLVTFNNPDALQRQNGQAFTATLESGTPLATQAGTNGAGTGWAAADVAGYVDLVVSKASDVRAMAALRAGLRAQVKASPLCDGPSFGRNLGRALRHAWTEWCEGR